MKRNYTPLSEQGLVVLDTSDEMLYDLREELRRELGVTVPIAVLRKGVQHATSKLALEGRCIPPGPIADALVELIRKGIENLRQREEAK